MMSVALAAALLAVFSGSLVNGALPVIGCALHSHPNWAPSIASTHFLALAAMLPFSGAVGDRFGSRRSIGFGLMVIAAASLLCACSTSLAALLIGRCFQGLGAALVLPNAISLIGGASSGGETAGRLARYSAACTAASGFGPYLGTMLGGCDGWRWVFGAIALAGVFVGLLLIPSPPARGVDSRPTASLRSERMRPDASWRSVLLAPAMIATTGFTLLLYGAYFGLLLILPVVLTRAGGYSLSTANAALLPLSLGPVLISPLIAALMRRLDARVALLMSSAPVAAAIALLAFANLSGRYETQVLPALLLMAAGMALAGAPLIKTVLELAGARQAGLACGVNSAAARLGGALATSLFSPLFAGASEEVGAKFQVAMSAELAICLAAAAVAGFLIAGSGRPAATDLYSNPKSHAEGA